jgi:ribosomal protein L7/L12
MTDKAIVIDALRRMILDDNVYTHDRSAALDELVSIKMQEAREESRVTTSELWCNNMNVFREHRRNNHRIATIKEVRKVFNCGLMEALIIVKGIESHDNILT